MKKTAKKGDIVKVEYLGTFDNGKQFDSSEGKEPIEFTLGSGEMIEGFDSAVLGMKVGEVKKIRIPAEKAYGLRDESMIEEMPIKAFEVKGIKLKIGMIINIGGENATIIKIKKDKIILDFNHPLAGKALNFKIKLLAVI